MIHCLRITPSSFSNGGFRKTEVILALIMWSQILTTSFAPDKYWEEFGSKLYDEGGTLEWEPKCVVNWGRLLHLSDILFHPL